MKKLYSFKVSIEEEVVKDVEKKVRRKDKETGKMKTITETAQETVKEEVPIDIIVKHPTRSVLEDGDMFYSVWLNKYIKMGLLTRAMLTKQYLDTGGQFTQENQQEYAELMLEAFNKQTAIESLNALGEDLNNEQKERLDKYVRELAVIRRSLTDFELLQGSVFEHTADNKARNKAVMWYILNLAYYQKEGDKEATPLFNGVDFESRYDDYNLKEDMDDPIMLASLGRLTSVVTLWYMSGINNAEDLEKLFEQMAKEEEANSEEELVATGDEG